MNAFIGGQVFGQRLFGRAQADAFGGVGAELADLRTHIVEKALDGAQFAGARLGAVVGVAHMVQVRKDIPLGNFGNILGGNARQVDFGRVNGVGYALPKNHHKTEKPAQVKIVAIDRARRAQLDKIEIMQIFHNIVGDIQIRCMAFGMNGINVTAHR